jgi:hypothetical protein
MTSSIPVYQADGSLYASVSEQQLARLELAGLVARVVRHRKGHINRAFLFTRTGEPKPTSAGYVMGTRYSFKESLGHGEAWDLTHLGGNHGGKNYAPTETRAAFGQVVADCTSQRRTGPGGSLQSSGTRVARPSQEATVNARSARAGGSAVNIV